MMPSPSLDRAAGGASAAGPPGGASAAGPPDGASAARSPGDASAAGAPDGAFAEVYAGYYDPMVRLACLTTGDVAAAEDVVQDAFVALYRAWPQVRDPAAWLRRVVVNRSVSWLRRLLTARHHVSRHRLVEAATPPEQPPPGYADPAVRAALARLTARQRAAVFLRYYLDLPEAEIAAALGCRPGTVKSLLHRALAVLKEHLDAD